MSTPDSELSFEQAVERLEAVVAELESGTLPLEECLRRFEQAVALSRHCSTQLKAAEQQIEVLTTGEGLRPAGGPGRPEEEESGESWF